MNINRYPILTATGTQILRMVAGIALGIWLTGCQQATEEPETAVKTAGTAERDLSSDSIILTHNAEIPVHALQDQWVVVNFWAEWCAPCRAEIPDLNRLNERHDVQVLGVDFDQHPAAALLPLIEKMDIRFPVLLDKHVGDLQLEWPNVLPVTYVIRQQQLRATLQGPQTLESLTELLSTLVPES